MMRLRRLLPLVLLSCLPSFATASSENVTTSLSVFDIHTPGIWRQEVRGRDVARSVRNYNWVINQRIWLDRNAVGVWVSGQALESFTCVSNSIVRNPMGPGFWRIRRTFYQNDVRRFRLHYRVFWVGHANTVIRDSIPDPSAITPPNSRFTMTMDHLEMVLPVEPTDPTQDTDPPINELVEITDENGGMHLLGQPGFETMPDTQLNPGGYQLATTELSTYTLPPAAQRISDPGMPPMTGQVEISPGVVMEFLMDVFGNVQVDHAPPPGPDDPFSSTVLGREKHQGLVGQPTRIDGDELPVDQNVVPLQLYSWALTPSGEVLGALSGQNVIGPPVDMNGNSVADNALGAPVPMDPTVRDIDNVLDPAAQPVDVVIEEDDEPTSLELSAYNAKLTAAGLADVYPPFKFGIKRVKLRKAWGIDRRMVMDTWLHHWVWSAQNYVVVRAGPYRVCVSKVGLSSYTSDHRKFPVGQSPQASNYGLQHLRFFRLCYRIYRPHPDQVRIKVDQLFIVVPLDANDPNSDLMALVTTGDENKLFQIVPPPVLAGLQPDPLPFGQDGVFMEPLDPITDCMDIGGGGTNIFDGDLSALGTSQQNVPVVANEDLATELRNDQLQLYCWILSPNGTMKSESFTDQVHPSTPVVFTIPGTPAIPWFRDANDLPVPDPTLLALRLNLVTGVEGPQQFAARLHQNVPNPFNGSTTVWFSVPGRTGAGETLPVRLSIFDVQGREITRLLDGRLEPGNYTIPVERSDLGRSHSAVFFYRLEVAGEKITRKLVPLN